MFTDMVGFSARAQVDEGATLALLDRHNRLLRPIFSKFHGREVKTVGDAFVVEFESALDATRCALDAQRMLHYYNLRVPTAWKIQIRIGIHVGDVVETDGDVLGDSVNIAARIVTLAGPEGICLSQQVYDQVANKSDTTFAKLPPVSLKNVRASGSIYRVVPVWDGASTRGPKARASRNRVIAVLPLSSISPDPHDGYFADGLTEELISELSQVRGLSVIARTSVAPYKTAPKSIAEVAHELGADTIVEGSVRKAGSQVRISLTLVDAETQRHLWTHRYDRELDDVFAVQEDIAKCTSKALRLEFDRAEPSDERAPAVPNPRFGTVTTGEAYDHYLRGIVAANNHDLGHEEAVRHFELATRLDPGLAEAFAAWANLYVTIGGDSVPMREVIPRARELAKRALELSPELSEAHSALGNIALQSDHDWTLAETEFTNAIALNSSNVGAYRFYGLLLRILGRYDEAKQVYRRSILLDPGGHDQFSLAVLEILTGNVDAGVRMAEEAGGHHQRDSPSHRAHLGFIYLLAGRRADALRAAAATPSEGASDDDLFDNALLNALVGRPDAARRVAEEVERGASKSYVSPAYLAMLYAAMGERERALDLLEQDYREGDAILWLYHRDIFFDSVRDDPRFVSLLHEYHLPPSPSPGKEEASMAP